jgi:hypothetical protein
MGSAAMPPVPAACLRDTGEPVVLLQAQAWLFLVNFNVSSGTNAVSGCMVTTDGAARVTYTVFTCTIMGSVPVLNGIAHFGGEGHIVCPFDVTRAVKAGQIGYDNFWVMAITTRTADSANDAHANPIFNHPSVNFYLPTPSREFGTTFQASFGELYTLHASTGVSVTASSWFNKSSTGGLVLDNYFNTEWVGEMVVDQSLAFNTVPTTINIGYSAFGVPNFANIQLHELIVDPAGRCCEGG